MARYVPSQWASGNIAAPFGPINGTRLNHLETWLETIFTDYDGHVAAADPHSQYILKPAVPTTDGPVIYQGGGIYVSQKLTDAHISAGAGIAKSKLGPLAIGDADVAAGAAIAKSKLDLAGQITAADLAAGAALPAGAMVPYGGNTSPAGWVLCDGAAYDGTNSTYTALWLALQTRFGGTGQSNFNVPDTRGRMLVGKGTATAVDTVGKNDGVALGNRMPFHSHSHTLTLPNHGHSHTLTLPNHTHNYNSPNGVIASTAGANTNAGITAGVTAPPNSLPAIDGAVGNPTSNPAINGTIGTGAAPQDTPAFLVVNHIIKL